MLDVEQHANSDNGGFTPGGEGVSVESVDAGGIIVVACKKRREAGGESRPASRNVDTGGDSA